jgi:folate-binding protein YgfZ
MDLTPAYQTPAALQERMASGTYLGGETVLHYGDPVKEFATLREGFGVFRLDWRAKIAVTGKDRVRWLHNMVTNNVRDLALNRGNYNFVLNAQGRILGDMYIYNRGESLLIDTDQSNVEPLLASMKRFIIMDKVEMSVAPMVVFGICGPRAEENDGLGVKGMELLEIREFSPDKLVVRGPQNKPGWYEVWVSGETSFQINFMGPEHLVGTQALEWWRVFHGIPQYGQDIRDRDLPQETEQTQALNFTKGCYIGQEIVERIRSRGQVHRTFTGFEFEGGLPALGKADRDGRTIAEVTSAVTIPAASGNRNIGLGYIRREIADAGSQLDLGGHKARIAGLPFAI